LNRLKQLRTEKNITQDVLAKLLCMEVAGYSKLETERVPLKDEYIIKLADFFGVSTDYLLGKSDERNPKKDNINEDDVKLVADSGFRGLNDYNKKVAIELIKGLKAKQDIEDKK
jgi:transcriptional regulator with XRE-family HTH domain